METPVDITADIEEFVDKLSLHNVIIVTGGKVLSLRQYVDTKEGEHEVRKLISNIELNRRIEKMERDLASTPYTKPT